MPRFLTPANAITHDSLNKQGAFGHVDALRQEKNLAEGPAGTKQLYDNRSMTIEPTDINEWSSSLAAICCAAALDVAPYLRRAARTVPPYDTKSDMHDPVTVHDRAVELQLQEFLSNAVPGSRILGEEMGEQTLPGGKETSAVGALGDRVRWIVDPIDGTANFAAGSTYFGTSVAAELDGTIVAGAISIPFTGEVFVADNNDAWHLDRDGNRTQMRATGATSEGEALLVSYFPGTSALNQNLETSAARMRELCNAYMVVRRPGAAALDLAATAAGWCGGVLATKLGPWDVAAGLHLVRVAGGRVINLPMGTDRPEGLRPGVLATLGSYTPNTAERILRGLDAEIAAGTLTIC